MTRQECESKLLSLAQQMGEVYTEYNPTGDFLTVYVDGGYINVSDSFFDKDDIIIRDENGDAVKTVNVTRYRDGHIRYGCPVEEDAE